MKLILTYIPFFLVSILYASDPILEDLNLNFAKGKNVKGIKIWKVNTNNHDDQLMVRHIKFDQKESVDRIEEFVYDNAEQIKTKYAFVYKYNKQKQLDQIVCQMDGTPYKFIRQFYNGSYLIRQVHFQTKTSFDYVEGYDYYPDGKVSRSYINKVPSKLMISRLHKYSSTGLLEQVIVKQNKIATQNWFYTYSKDQENILIKDIQGNKIGHKVTKYYDNERIYFVEESNLNKYEKIEFEYYQNQLLKIIRRYNSPGKLAQYYYELEYEFFD